MCMNSVNISVLWCCVGLYTEEAQRRTLCIQYLFVIWMKGLIININNKYYLAKLLVYQVYTHTAVTEAGKVGGSLAQDFFRYEYILNHLIGKSIVWRWLRFPIIMYTICTGTYGKPFIAIQDGITMGGVSDMHVIIVIHIVSWSHIMSSVCSSTLVCTIKPA